MLSERIPARVGLLGNPSDGYGGKCLSLAVDAFGATVTLERIDGHGIEIVPGPEDLRTWRSPAELVDRVDRFGLGTGDALLTATVRTFLAVADSIECSRPGGFRLRYETDIPRQVGLAGSSALVVAALRCLARSVEAEIPSDVLASIALSVETDRMGITAGLQDRVVQSYGGLVAMDFSDMETVGRFGVSVGRYTTLDPASLPPLFLAFRPLAAADSGGYHGELRERWDGGDPLVHATMRSLAQLVPEGRALLTWQDRDGSRAEQFGRLIAANAELRSRLGELPPLQQELLDVAAWLDVPVTSTGSGGAVVGVYEPDDLARIERAYGRVGAEVVAITAD